MHTLSRPALHWAAVVAAVILVPMPRPSPAVAGGMAIEMAADQIVITTGSGMGVARFTHGDPAVGRPALRDLHSPNGIMVTRPCPPRAGVDLADHETMHPGVMLCFSDLSGSDPWRHKTAVRFTGFAVAPAVIDAATVRFTFTADYLASAGDSPEAPVVCRERSTITIADRPLAGAAVRIVDWRAEITAGSKPVTFGDVEEMGLGIRVVKPLAPIGGGRYVASHGGRDEAGVFGRPAAWVAVDGRVDDRPVGVLLVDRSAAPRQATFHARDAGWLLANPFGRRCYGQAESGAVRLEPEAALQLHFLVIVHDGHGDASPDALAREAIAAVAAW